ncbi:Zn(II)2Cys6 transcription factor [Aspergillus stella-maris]|uniref:Zn(II)2Cys6 transcription factor n=1 Tax=Aspergillus stella-maris TaxID=1810926 RepID=UPI003CCDC3BC
MPATRSASRTLKPRRTGCQNCRKRRIKCDEKGPCGYCSRRNLDCKRPNFIVAEVWSNQSTNATVDKGSVHNAPVLSENQPSSVITVHPHSTPSDILTAETVGLLKIYQKGIGIWMDIFDRSQTYQNEVVKYSMDFPLLMHAICALSARQMSLSQAKFVWEPIASRFYGESLRLLIRELSNQDTQRDLLLAATILLGSYELLEQPGIDYQRHLYGANTLIQTHDIRHKSTPLDHASFWIYARQDVALALGNERPTLTPPDQWPIPSSNESDPVEDHFGKRMLWLLARVVDVRFSETGLSNESSSAKRTALESLVSEIDLLWTALPSHVRGAYLNHKTSKEEDLSSVWFCAPSAAAGCLYYHMAKIIAYQCLLEVSGPTPVPPSEDSESLGRIRHHAYAIASICLSSDLVDGALVVAVNPIFYAAKYIPSLAVKTRLWGILD